MRTLFLSWASVSSSAGWVCFATKVLAHRLKLHSMSVICHLLWLCRPREIHATGSRWASTSSSFLHKLDSLQRDLAVKRLCRQLLPVNDIDLSGSQTPAHRLGSGVQLPLWLQLLWDLEDHLLAIRTGCPGSLSLCPLPLSLSPSLPASQALPSLHPALGVMHMAQGT